MKPLAFFAPHDIDDLAAALAWLDEQASPDDRRSWSALQLPMARPHPRAPDLFAAAAGVNPAAIAAVFASDAFIDDDGALRLWPWYPEQDAIERPLAERRCAELGVAMPREQLDLPHEPAHYLKRCGASAVATWLRGRGIDPSVAMIDRIPVPPRGDYPDEKFEGGITARARVIQAAGAVAYEVRLSEYATSERDRAEVERRLDAALARLSDVIAGREPNRAAPEPQPVEPVPPSDEPANVGRVGTVFALDRGALIATDGALIEIDRAGAFVNAWPAPLGELFARGDVAVVNYGYVLDLAAGRFLDTGDVADATRRMGLDELPSTGGHDERTAPAISACGRYLLDVDESPYIVRLIDNVTVAEGRALERVVGDGSDDDDDDGDDGPPKKRRRGLIEPDAIEVAKVTVIDGVRFALRPGQSPVRDGRSLAFALAGDAWRFLVGDEVLEAGKVIARLGVTIAGGAFRADGKELWVLGTDHAIRVELEPAPKVAAIVPLAPILHAADKVLA